MKRPPFGFLFYPVLLGSAVFLVASMSSMYSDLGKEMVYERLEGFKLVGNIIGTFYTNEIGCGLRCLQNEKCRSYNSKSDADRDEKECQLSNHTRQTSPESLRQSPGFTYYGEDVRGWHPSYPAHAHSCKDIRDTGDSRGDGEYWIDPERNGNPLKVYCDMTTYGGGWLLVSSFVTDGSTPPVEASYHAIGKLQSSNVILQKSAMNELRTRLSFTQLRFHCSKQQGRTFHVITADNSTGEAVVQYFSGQTDVQPDACDSFVKMEDDNSNLAGVCENWGRENGAYNVGKWGHGDDQERLYHYPTFTHAQYHVVILFNWFHGGFDGMFCDDSVSVSSTGDFWKVFVR